MDVTRAEFAAVGGVECDLLDAGGRLIVTPHPVTLDGQTNVPADLRPGESLEAFLTRHVPGIASGAWAVSLGGHSVPQHMWARTYPKHGNLIACRCVVKKAALQLIAMAALTYFTMGAGAAWIGTTFGVGAAATSAIGAGLFMAGSVLINKVLGPKVPKPADNGPGRAVHSLSAQRNNARPFEPLPVLWGEMRTAPDLASRPYTWSEGDDQYLSTILLGGINVHKVSDLSVGDTPLSSFEGVEVYHNGYSGMPSVPVPLYSNADTIAGGELANEGAWVTRTSSTGTIALQVDIEGQLYDVDNEGGILINTVPLTIERRSAGSSGAWTTLLSETLRHAETALLRRTFAFSVPLGQHEVRARLGKPLYNEGDGKDACKLAWTVLKSIQPDTTDYSQWGRSGIKIKATGQISGSFDQVQGTYTARPLPVWNGLAWVDGTLRSNGLSNPGAIILQALRGIYAFDAQAGQMVLQFGFGMQDAQIDIEGLKAFMLHCTAKGYTYDRWITSSMSLQAFCDEVALAGMGQFTWTDGSRPTVSFVGSGQPTSAVVNMANMLKGSFSVAYNLANAADGIEYQYLDRNRNWETQTLRVTAPGVTTMLNPARITGEGVTTEAHAAVMARYHLAQSLYQYKTIDFTADIEHLDYRRLSVLSVSHDLTQWGYGGRVMKAETLAGKVVLTLDEEVPTLATRFVGLRVPGERDYRVFGVEAFAGKSSTLTLVGAWPGGVAFPGGTLANPAHDTLWCYDFKSTPGYRVRVVGMEPESDLKGARVTCVPEGPEFWDYVLNGNYVPAPNQSILPLAGRPAVSNLRITEQVHMQGDTEWTELHAVWDVEGDYDHAQVWAGRDGSELRLVDGNAVSTRASFRIESAGEWLIEVRPFNTGGLVGQGAAVLYITSRTSIPPRNVDQFVVQVVEGGLRRFAWQYTGDRPPALAGVQIRYLPGDVPLSEAGWAAMTPLGAADDVYAAQFESTRPAAGQWTFGIRAINTSGLLSPGVLRFAISLPASLPAAQGPDLTPPPKPTGVTATALMSTAQVNWTAPSYTQGRGHGHSIISAAVVVTGQPVPVFSAAVKVGTPEGQPASIPVELGGVKYRLWVQHVSKDGAASLPSDPVEITTSVDPAKILEILTGQLGTSQLSSSLSTPIGLITAPAGTVGSVNARIEAQRTALQGNIDAVQAQLAEVTGAAEYVAGTTYTAGKLAKYQSKLYRAKSNTTGNLPTNTTYWELVGEYASIGEAVAAHAVQLSDQLTRIQNVEGNLTTEASNRNTLAVQLRGNYTGDDPNALTSGLSWNEKNARVAADSANTTLIQGVRTDLTAEQGRINGHANAIGALQSDVSSIDGRVTSASNSLTTLNNTIAHPTTGLAAVQTAAQNAATAAGAKGEVIYGTAQPTVAQRLAQNLWIDTAGSANTPKRWSGSAWVAVTDKVATDAAAAAAAAAAALTSKADSSVVSALSGTVTSQGDTLTSQGNSLLALNNAVNNPTTGLSATAASAAQALSKATLADDKASAQVSQIATLLAKVGNSASILTEDWSSAAPLDKWEVLSGTGERAIATVAGTTSGKVLRLGNNAGNDQVRIGHLDNILYEPTKTYRVTVKARRTAGAGFLYVGWTGIAANGTTYVNISGGNTTDNAHYHTANGEAPADWVTYTGYTLGHGSPNGTTPVGTVGTPGKMHSSAVFVRPQIMANYNGVAGTFEIDSIVVSDLSGAQGLTAALETEATVRASETGHLMAQQTVKLDVGGLVSGYGLASTASTAAPTSAFGVQAGQFFVAPPAVAQASAPTANLFKGFAWYDTGAKQTRYYTGSGWSTTPQILPFSVQTVPQTINGEVVPPGIYADAAFFAMFVAKKGQIGALAVDDAAVANLSASKLITGTVSVGAVISSSNYVAGSAGWRIHGNGTAEFSGVIVRGTVYATAGSIGGNTITSNAIMSPAVTSFSTGNGFFLGSDGKARFGNATGARLQWTGTAVEIYNAAGQLTLSSGGVDWSAVAGRPTTLAGLDSTAGGKLAGIAAGATVGADASNLRAGVGSNLIFNGDFKDSIIGTFAGWRSAGPLQTIDRNQAGYVVQGEGTMYVTMAGSPAAGTQFDMAVKGPSGAGYAVVAGARYEASAWLNAHRCTGKVTLLFTAVDGTQLADVSGNTVTKQSGISAITDMEQSVVFAVAPAGATRCYVNTRATVTAGANPTLFASRVFLAEATAAQTSASAWSPGAGITRITPANASTYMADASMGRAQMGYAAIGTAEIEQLSVKTFHVGDNEITVPVSAYIQGVHNNQTSNLENTVSVQLPPHAGVCQISLGASVFGNTSVHDAIIYLYVDGEQRFSWSFGKLLATDESAVPGWYQSISREKVFSKVVNIAGASYWRNLIVYTQRMATRERYISALGAQK